MKNLKNLMILILLASGCRREARPLRPEDAPTPESTEASAYAVSEGKRLFTAMNCNGCHADGGGAIGPALMDDKWIHGSEPEAIFDTLRLGREDGMPAFGGVGRTPEITVVGRLSDQQLWQLVAYVRSGAGLLSPNVAGSRNDHMQTRLAEASMPRQPPVAAPSLEPSPDAGGPAAMKSSVLEPAGVQAALIADLWSLFLAVCTVVWLLVMAVLVGLIVRRSREPAAAGVERPAPGREARTRRVVLLLLAVTTLILFVFLFSDFVAGRRIMGQRAAATRTIRVTTHQWWWEFRYDDPVASESFTTANEIHLPVGETVRFEIVSPDVIHSFWVPNLHGKTDAIPGHTTETFLRADTPGEYFGSCAEFCGAQHANMRFRVVAESKAEFETWKAAQQQNAATPVRPEQIRGREVFLRGTCVLCHTVQGTPAASRVGPDLTHVASRSRLAAGTLPMDRAALMRWIADAQSVKPGVRMPVQPLSAEDLAAVTAYLEMLR